MSGIQSVLEIIYLKPHFHGFYLLALKYNLQLEQLLIFAYHFHSRPGQAMPPKLPDRPQNGRHF